MTSSAADLSKFEIPGIAKFTDTEGGLVRLDITTELAKAAVYLHGAHVTEFTPAGERPLLFTSAKSLFAAGKPIRGGVPIIFPWFGPRAGDAKAPAHGFARTSLWEVESIEAMSDGDVCVCLQLSDSEATRATWPHAFSVRHKIRIGSRLEMNLHVENRSTQAFTFEEAFHTYLNISDIRRVKIHGLGGITYIDKVDAMARKEQSDEPITFHGETDRVYVDTFGTCTLEDPVLARKIIVEKEGSASTVIWNPWSAKAAAMADFGDDEWPGMACIETANAADDAVNLAPGSEHVMRAVIRCES